MKLLYIKIKELWHSMYLGNLKNYFFLSCQKLCLYLKPEEALFRSTVVLLYYFTIIRKYKAQFLHLGPQLHNLECLDKLIKALLGVGKPNVLSTVNA